MGTVLLAEWTPCCGNGHLGSPGLALVVEPGGEGWGAVVRASRL